MRQRFFLLGMAVVTWAIFLAGCDGKDPAPPPPRETEAQFEGTIAAVGDSLTAGFGLTEDEAYPALLQKRLLSEGYRYKVVNAGISGETSSGTLSRINWIMTLEPDIVIIETGANDGFRGIDPALIEKNLDDMVRQLKERNVVVVLAGMRIVQNLGRDYTTAFENVYKRVAERHGIILIPFFLAGVAGEPALNLPDTIHPKAEGYRIVVENVFPHVIRAIEAVRKKKG